MSYQLCKIFFRIHKAHIGTIKMTLPVKMIIMTNKGKQINMQRSGDGDPVNEQVS